MASETLDNDFLNDLDELGDDFDDETNEVVQTTSTDKSSTIDSTNEQQTTTSTTPSTTASNVKQVAGLLHEQKFASLLQQVREALKNPTPRESTGPLEDSSDYQLVVECNKALHTLDDNFDRAYQFVVDRYSVKFPELPQLIPNAMDYIKVVQKIKNETDMTLVDLASVIPAAQVMVVSVTGSTTTGRRLTSEELEQVMEGCDEAIALYNAKDQVIKFIESRMSTIAPNVSILLGTTVAAELVGVAGGLIALSKIPACNVQVIGQRKKVLSGFSRAAAMPHEGIIYRSPIVQSAPPGLRRKTAKVLAGRVVLSARVDSFHQFPSGAKGRSFLEEIEQKIEKWQEPAPAKKKKALPRPDDRPSRKRGGKRYRAMKEKLGLTDIRKEANRMSFAESGGEYGDTVMGVTAGRLGQSGTGKMRLERKEQKILKKHRKALNIGGSSGATSGLASSLAFTPHQGMELVNPEAAAERIRKANEKYFGESGTFTQVRRT